MRCAILIGLLLLSACTPVCYHGGTCNPGRDVTGTLIVAAAVAVAVATEESRPGRSGAWCVEDSDPPHSCPARAGPDR